LHFLSKSQRLFSLGNMYVVSEINKDEDGLEFRNSHGYLEEK
jgi:hypothetical protein